MTIRCQCRLCGKPLAIELEADSILTPAFVRTSAVCNPCADQREAQEAWPAEYDEDDSDTVPPPPYRDD